MAKLYKGFQSDVYDANFPMVGGGEQFMCPTVAFHSVAKTWANKRDGTPVLYSIAPTNNMVASECDDNCAWNGPQYNGTAEVRQWQGGIWAAGCAAALPPVRRAAAARARPGGRPPLPRRLRAPAPPEAPL
jgi:hypothetical protein